MATNPANVDAVPERIAEAIRDFPFWDYGMDDVDPDSEYAEWVPALAEKIAALDLCRGAQVEEDHVRAAERERVARYLERMAKQKLINARDSVAPQFGATESMALREAVAAIREPSVWAPDESVETAPETAANPPEPAQNVSAVGRDTSDAQGGAECAVRESAR